MLSLQSLLALFTLLPSHRAYKTALSRAFQQTRFCRAVSANKQYEQTQATPLTVYGFSVCVCLCVGGFDVGSCEQTASGFMAPYLRVALASSTSLLSHSEDKKIASTLVRSPLCPSTGCPCVAALHILAKVDHN